MGVRQAYVDFLRNKKKKNGKEISDENMQNFHANFKSKAKLPTNSIDFEIVRRGNRTRLLTDNSFQSENAKGLENG